jgi:hypothetical protein
MTLHPEDITLAARTMTEAEPPADLEARIKQRLDAATIVRPTSRRWPIVAGFATVMATAVILVMQSPDVTKSRGPEVVEVPGSRSSQVLAVQSRGPEVVEVGPRELRNSGTSEPREPRNLGTSTEAELAWLSRRIPALEVIDPLSVDRMTFESIQPEAMLITPLTITPLVTSPVHGDPDAGRQHFD